MNNEYPKNIVAHYDRGKLTVLDAATRLVEVAVDVPPAELVLGLADEVQSKLKELSAEPPSPEQVITVRGGTFVGFDPIAEREGVVRYCKGLKIWHEYFQGDRVAPLGLRQEVGEAT
jgi:hypothetical protein